MASTLRMRTAISPGQRQLDAASDPDADHCTTGANLHGSPALNGNRSDLLKQIVYFLNKVKFLGLKNVTWSIAVFQIFLWSTIQKRLTLSRLLP